MDAEVYTTGTFRPLYAQTTIEAGGRYQMRKPFILLFMAGRSVEPARTNQPYFVGYFGVQMLLPIKKSDKE